MYMCHPEILRSNEPAWTALGESRRFTSLKGRNDCASAGGRIHHGLNPTSWPGRPTNEYWWRCYGVVHHEVKFSSSLLLLGQVVFGVMSGHELSCQEAGPVLLPL